ncbi:cytochrome C oxidase subunit IV family protein [Thalassomonas actiniarum]|uniref:Cytochrome C oxidase subunit IV family protein n=1 Tax=Thalassomonas actiniarum TaxID=485447 RepID=A0AAF0C369_9GAMM|nr:cytochrome C oxidase subunit IV family protein [Thalassomonas actiniarum]WDD98620.1 cytochrome C oxidase subunit IV family protein [Thalassomonas actiniarum]
MLTNLYRRARRSCSEQSFNIWLRLIALTLPSAAIAETGNTSVTATIVVCLIVMAKGHWVIGIFMELKHASPLSRRIVKGYFYGMTMLVGVIVAYSQI